MIQKRDDWNRYNRAVRGLQHIVCEEWVREQCLKAEKAVVRSVHSHCLVMEKAKPRSFSGVTMEKTNPINLLQPKKF